jgi:hypothetical protein
MTYTHLCALCFFLLLAMPVRAGDPHPPQLNVTFLAQPAAIVQEGATKLYYEMVVSNFQQQQLRLGRN